MRRSTSVNRVVFVASVLGLASLVLLDFGVVAPLRIAEGKPASLLASVGSMPAVLLTGAWVVLLALSLVGSRSPSMALARGLVADAIIVAEFAASGLAANRLLATESPLARYSIGAGVWLSAFFAFSALLASRRAAGRRRVASLFVAFAAPVGIAALVLSGSLSKLGMAAEYRNAGSEFWLWTGAHLLYTAVALLIATTAGLVLGVAAYRRPSLARGVFGITGFVQTIPGLAMVGILSVPLAALATNVPLAQALGIGVLGWAPLVTALTLYALLAIVRNTYAGLAAVPRATVESAYAMGMTRGQVLRKVEVPLAAPVIFSGVRTAAQQTIGTATLGFFVAANTLGRPIFNGVSQTANDLVLLGSITLVVLALTVDGLMRGAQRLVTPRHLRSAE